MKPSLSNAKIAVIGLGYVGLPLAVEFGKIRKVVGFDINHTRISELKNYEDKMLEVSSTEMRKATGLSFTNSISDLNDVEIFIITVPTPIDNAKRPDLSPLISASTLVGSVMKKGAVVVYESTVFPGATEEICVPILEKTSGLIFNRSFFCGYSPERVNPGDKNRKLPNVVKITSGSTAEVADFVDKLYSEILEVGTHKVSSIQVAEAAKVIENTQRDLNIALMNELSVIFDRLGIDTLEVLEAAETKWNFLPFKPGLVGGHCIGVDPYYLTHKSQEAGYHPEVILAGRRINDAMPMHVAQSVVKLLLKGNVELLESEILVLGLAFKENCPDLRNSKAFDLIQSLKEFSLNVFCFDPWLSIDEVEDLRDIGCLDSLPQSKKFDAVILAVAHEQFVTLGG